jgi:hypothetical protein
MERGKKQQVADSFAEPTLQLGMTTDCSFEMNKRHRCGRIGSFSEISFFSEKWRQNAPSPSLKCSSGLRSPGKSLSLLLHRYLAV